VEHEEEEEEEEACSIRSIATYYCVAYVVQPAAL